MAVLHDAKLERFAREYVIDRNGKRAAIAVGYAPGSAKVRATELLRKDEVAARVVELETILLKQTDITAERVKLELARVAFADPRRMYDANDELIPVRLMDADTAATIAGMTTLTHVTEVKDARSGKITGTRTTTTTKVKTVDKQAALRTLAQHFKIIGSDLDETLSAALALNERLQAARARRTKHKGKA